MKASRKCLIPFMLKKDKIEATLDTLETLFPNACCELKFNNLYELLIAIILSAQTTDKAVNKVTPILFQKYDSFSKLAKASIDEVKQIITPLGLANNKSKNIISLAQVINEKYNDVVPIDFDELIKLPGIGRKTANVYLSEGLGVPRIAVDTHVERVSKRLDIASQDASTLMVENILMQNIRQERWHQAHLLLLFFGRYLCTASKPHCNECPFNIECKNRR